MTTTTENKDLMVQGRIVWGVSNSLFEGKKLTNDQGQPQYDENGQQVVQYGFGLAIPKIDPRTNQPTAEFQKIWQALHQEAFTLYPSGQLPPDFAMKYKDGDGVDHNGKPFNLREGYAGHIVLACTTQIPIKFFKYEGGNNIMVNDGIKCGDYVNVQLFIKAHPAKGRGKAGLYVNPSAVQLIQSGKEIINAPSGDQIFGMAAPSYVGEVVAPVAPTMPNFAAPTPGVPQAPVVVNPPLGTPAYATQAPVANPHYGVLPQTHQPQAVPPMGNGMTHTHQGIAMPATTPSVGNQANYAGQYATPPAYPSNGMPPMPGMPR